MCGRLSSILHYGPLIETNYLYAEWAKPECFAKQKQYPLVYFIILADPGGVGTTGARPTP